MDHPENYLASIRIQNLRCGVGIHHVLALSLPQVKGSLGRKGQRNHNHSSVRYHLHQRFLQDHSELTFGLQEQLVGPQHQRACHGQNIREGSQSQPKIKQER